MRSESQNDAGFVLPYVLVVIAILAIAGTIAAQRLQKASAVVGDMQERARAEQILQSAEMAATYSILTGNPVTGGYDLSPRSPIVWEFGLLSPDGRRPLREDDVNAMDKDIWTGTGTLRRYDIAARSDDNTARSSARSQLDRPEAIVAYQDASGLASLNNGNPNLLLPILEAVGASRTEARELLDKLNDYTDVDDSRRPRGAESFDYRTRKLPPPPNAPLRSYEELGQIIGWAEVMPRLDMRKLKDLTTLQMGPGYRARYAPEDLRRLLSGVMGGEGDSLMPSQSVDILAQVELNSTQPSQYARFMIWVPRADGRYQKRVVDIERFLSGVGEPYRRHLVYDSTVLESDLKPIAGPLSADPDGPLQLDELNHVVHAPSLRPYGTK